MPTYLVLGIWISVGLAAISRIAGDRLVGSFSDPHKIAATGVYTLGLGISLLGVAGTYGEVDRSQDHLGERMIRAVSQNVELGATVVHRRGPLLYMQMVQNRREDIDLWDWRVDHTREERARANEALARGRLYLLSPKEAMIDGFWEAGYNVSRVQGDLLYLVTPPESGEPAPPRRSAEPPAAHASFPQLLIP